VNTTKYQYFGIESAIKQKNYEMFATAFLPGAGEAEQTNTWFNLTNDNSAQNVFCCLLLTCCPS